MGNIWWISSLNTKSVDVEFPSKSPLRERWKLEISRENHDHLGGTVVKKTPAEQSDTCRSWVRRPRKFDSPEFFLAFFR